MITLIPSREPNAAQKQQFYPYKSTEVKVIE